MSAIKYAMAGTASKQYVDDVFSTYLYDGNTGTQTITNGIDLAGKGGMVWSKKRSGATSHSLCDSARGTGKVLYSNSTSSQVTDSGQVTAFNSNGYSIGSGDELNTSGQIYASWTFRKAPKFFDVVTYTGDGASSRNIAHSLGITPGMIIAKRTDSTSDWMVSHLISTTSARQLSLNLTQSAATTSGATHATDTYFVPSKVQNYDITQSANVSGATYVAYLFAHDTSADGIIQCGSYVGNGSTEGVLQNLGWEPQFVLLKEAMTTGDWWILDDMRGMIADGYCSELVANTVNIEANGGIHRYIKPHAQGFVPYKEGASYTTNNSGETYIYLAIRRPNKPPTTGTQVFQPVTYTGTNVDNRLVNTGIVTDMVWARQRNDTVLTGMVVGDRLRGQPYLLTGGTAAEVSDADSLDQQLVSAVEYGTAFSSMTGFWVGNDVTSKVNANTTASNHISFAFKRAPGFFDIVAYTGTGSSTTIPHNLAAVPELMIVKRRASVSTLAVWHKSLASGTYLALPSSSGAVSDSTLYTTTNPTDTVFSVGTSTITNAATSTYIAYLFATLDGISKVGYYVGNGGTASNNGTSQTIDCGFTTGARFIMFKNLTISGAWYVFDTARGITSGNDPSLTLNTTGAEITTISYVDTDPSGFVVHQQLNSNLNVTSYEYIYLAIA